MGQSRGNGRESSAVWPLPGAQRKGEIRDPGSNQVEQREKSGFQEPPDSRGAPRLLRLLGSER